MSNKKNLGFLTQDSCGGLGIRTPGCLSTSSVFKTDAIDRSAKPPNIITNIIIITRSSIVLSLNNHKQSHDKFVDGYHKPYNYELRCYNLHMEVSYFPHQP